MDNIFTINLLLFGTLGLALAWSEINVIDKPFNFAVIMVLVLMIQGNGR